MFFLNNLNEDESIHREHKKYRISEIFVISMCSLALNLGIMNVILCRTYYAYEVGNGETLFRPDVSTFRRLQRPKVFRD